jgi:transcriptional regulator with XRE-family HTH domain
LCTSERQLCTVHCTEQAFSMLGLCQIPARRELRTLGAESVTDSRRAGARPDWTPVAAARRSTASVKGLAGCRRSTRSPCLEWPYSHAVGIWLEMGRMERVTLTRRESGERTAPKLPQISSSEAPFVTMPAMDDSRVGSVLRAVRMRRGWRQADLAKAAGVSDSLVSRLERGMFENVPIQTVRRVLAVLDIRLDLVPRWHGGDLDRLLNARHSALHEEVARWLSDRYPGWVVAPEVSFSIYGERGVIDMLAWHSARRALLVIELKTDIVDVNELLGTLDRKRRLAKQIARERGWPAEIVGSALIVAASRTNRRRIDAHDVALRNSLPDDGRRLRAWLDDPSGGCDARLLWEPARSTSRPAVQRRIRRMTPSS